LELNQSIPAPEVERMMKLQDVLLKTMAKKISWLSAAEAIGVTPRTMRWRATPFPLDISDTFGFASNLSPSSAGHSQPASI
jgi:hypothetical protein